jgi:hypothetical protein
MPQNAGAVTVATKGGAQSPLALDAEGNLLVSPGSTSSSLNATAAKVIKATAGRVAKVTIINAGATSGAFTLNDCATTGAAAASNEIWTLPQASSLNVAGAVFELDWPCATGIVLSGVVAGGTVAISFT